MSTKNNRTYCCVFGCLNCKITRPELSFFTIPREHERRLQWLRLISREDLTNVLKPRVCEIHFIEEDVKLKATRKILKKNSVPCLHLPGVTAFKEDKQTQVIENPTVNSSSQTEIINVLESSSTQVAKTANFWSQTAFIKTWEKNTQTAASLSDADTPRKRKLKADLLACRKRLKVYEKERNSTKSLKDLFHKLCDRFLSKEFAEIVKAQPLLKSSHKGNRFTIAYKMFCLNLYYVSPQAYRLLQKSICLPCRTTLQKFYIPMSTHVNDDFMAALKLKVNNMSEREKHCTMIVDTMSLKTNLYYDINNDKIIGFHELDGIQSPSPAKYALVVLIRGIFVKWSQTIGFALISECKNDDNVTKWIDKIIIKLFEIGLKIRVFVSNLGSDLLNAAEKRGISVDKTYFTINDNKIYYIFDAPHLLKLIRNNFMTCDFHFQNGAVAKFEHIVKFYEYDSNKTYKQAQTLTNSHINPTNIEKKKVRFATQLLSRSVASGLSTYIDFQIIDESARHTVEFVKLINDLFDTLNSSTLKHSIEHKSAFSGDKKQIDFFKKMLSFFETLKLFNAGNGNDVTETVKFIQGFRITIQSILHLFEDLKQEGYQYILTRRLNRDIIEIFFGKIRSKNGIATEPTSRQFISAFDKIYFDNISQAPKGGNGAEDLTELLVRLNDYNGRDNECTEIDIQPAVDITQEKSLREIKSSEYTQIDLPKKNRFLYVCGVLLKKCVDHHKDCESLKCYMDADQRACNSSAESKDLNYKKFATDRNLLLAPNDFVANIERMEQIFHNAFEKEHVNCKIGVSIYEELINLELLWPCPCFPKNYLLKLFIRMRIYFVLNSNNKAFKTCRNRRKYFSVTNL